MVMMYMNDMKITEICVNINGLCFVKFESRLALQTRRNVKYVAERGEPGTLQGVPCPQAFFQWGSAIGRAPMAEPHRWGAPGPCLASSVRLFAPFPLVFG